MFDIFISLNFCQTIFNDAVIKQIVIKGGVLQNYGLIIDDYLVLPLYVKIYFTHTRIVHSIQIVTSIKNHISMGHF